MRRLLLLGALWAVLATADGRTFTDCFHITPQSPTVELYRNMTAFCIVDQECLHELKWMYYPISSRELFWKAGYALIPESQYTVINDSVSSVTFVPTQFTHKLLTCSYKLHGQTEVTLHGVLITFGYPPEKPENLTCMSNNLVTLTCTWQPGRETIIPTTYTLRQFWREGEKQKCKADPGNNFCTLTYPEFLPHIDTEFMVEAVNDLGSVRSELKEYDIINIVKTNPPDIVGALSIQQGGLKVEWKNPIDYSHFEYNIRYRPKDSSKWHHVPADDLKSTRNSFILQELESYTVYVLSMRCKLSDNTFWSEWSKEYTATTSESAPSRAPEFWRKIRKTDSEKRIVQLMWKDLASHANGIILGYNITVKKGPEVVNSFIVTNTTYDMTVSKDSCEVVLTAFNSQGFSPPATLIIPASAGTALQLGDLNFKAFSKTDDDDQKRLCVEWTPSRRVLGYVIEWCSNTVSMDCVPVWQREPSGTGTACLRGDIEPYIYYLIRLTVLQRDGQERSGTVGSYLEQAAPELGPIIHTKSTGKTWIALEWYPVPLRKQRGLVTSYTIQYKEHKESGLPKEITVNSTVTEYKLESLAAKTAYSVSVYANNERGNRSGPPLTFTTLPFENGEVEAIVVSSCLGFLVLILTLCFLFCHKREQIKKHIWPNVPDPSKSNIAQWSPQTPNRHDSQRHPFQDGAFTDVSVVEITASEKKPYSELDLKSADQIKKNTSEGLSSGIGGSSCLSSPQLSGSDSDGISSAQNTSSTVQYSTVIMSGYQGQTPLFSRSESTQPLLIAEERPDEQQQQQLSEEDAETPTPYFKQNFAQELPPAAPSQHPPAQILQLAGFSHKNDSPDLTAGQDLNPDSPSHVEDEQKMYLPQTARQGGYIPQ
ncbi:interleukin-11-mediated signaling pathway [Pristimantis euphronides]